MITLEFTDAATMEQQAVQAGLTLPIEQTAVWAKYQNTIDGRTPWGAYVVKQDGAPIAFIALIDYETHGYHYLRSVHGPAWLDKPSAQLEAQVRDLLVEDVRKRDKNVVFLRIDLWNFEGSFPVLSTVPYNETVYVDITGGDEAILTRMKKRGRRDVRKALRESPAVCADETAQAMADFSEYYEVMVDTANRDGFSPAPMSDYVDMISNLGPDHARVFVGTYWHYMFYGDKKIIEDNYDAGMRYLEHLKTKVTEEGFINHGLGDWGNPKNELARENIETAFLYADAVTLAKFAEILEKLEDKKKLEAYAEQVKKNYNEKLLVWNAEKGYWCYRTWDHADELFMTQAVEALPLYWGLVPEDKEVDVVKAFYDALETEGAFVSGEIGLPYVIQTARKYQMNNLICQFILRKEHPSYYAFVLDGETTLGEYWETNPRSHCHDMMGHIVEWYYNGIAGIQAEEPGFRKIKICPYLPESIHEFKCIYRSVAGEISVQVKEEQDGMVLQVKVPKGVEYQIDTTNLESSREITAEKIKIEVE